MNDERRARRNAAKRTARELEVKETLRRLLQLEQRRSGPSVLDLSEAELDAIETANRKGLR